MLSDIAEACGQRCNQETEYFRELRAKHLRAYVFFGRVFLNMHLRAYVFFGDVFLNIQEKLFILFSRSSFFSV